MSALPTVMPKSVVTLPSAAGTVRVNVGRVVGLPRRTWYPVWPLLTVVQKLPRWYASSYCVVPISTPPDLKSMLLKSGDAVVLVTAVWPLESFERGLNVVVLPPLVNFNTTGMMNTGMVVDLPVEGAV